jgi:hypothetical protein
MSSTAATMRAAAQPARLDAQRELLAQAARLDDRHEPVLR